MAGVIWSAQPSPRPPLLPSELIRPTAIRGCNQNQILSPLFRLARDDAS